MKIKILVEEGILVKVEELSRLQIELAILFYTDLEEEGISLDATITDEDFCLLLHQENFQDLSFMAKWLQAVETSIDNFRRLCEDVIEKITHFQNR